MAYDGSGCGPVFRGGTCPLSTGRGAGSTTCSAEGGGTGLVPAHAAREAMAGGVALGSCVAAGLLALGVLATLLIPAQRSQTGHVSQPAEQLTH